MSSMTVSRRVTSAAASLGSFAAAPVRSGAISSQFTAYSDSCTPASVLATTCGSAQAAAAPTAALHSSTAPSASTRISSLLTRRPPQILVCPASPLRV